MRGAALFELAQSEIDHGFPGGELSPLFRQRRLLLPEQRRRPVRADAGERFPDLPQRQTQFGQRLDRGEDADLLMGIPAVAVRPVDPGRTEKTDPVIINERLPADAHESGKFADGKFALLRRGLFFHVLLLDCIPAIQFMIVPKQKEDHPEI